MDPFLEELGSLSQDEADEVLKGTFEEEVRWAIGASKTNKSPGLDRLTFEFYKKTVDKVAGDLVDVFNNQLGKLKLVDSNRRGATRCLSKVDGIPMVTQLRPITLLNIDYKLLTKILMRRIGKVLGSVLKSVQSCSVPGSNICSAAVNLVSVVEGVERLGMSAAVLSLDLFKAFDRVNLNFLEVVMKKMKFPEKFLEWMRLVHRDAECCLLLDFITRPFKVTFSVRQGDPLAMILFLIYIEPLVMMVERKVEGVKFLVRPAKSLWCPEMVGLEERVEAYVEDVEVVVGSDADILLVDQIVDRFEEVSRAILNRSSKSVILGLGAGTGSQ